MRKLLILFFAVHLAGICLAQVKVQYLLTENKVDPISIDAINPRLSWQLNAGDKRSVMQTAYELKVSSQGKGKHEVWKTGKVMSDESMYITYKGEPLVAGQKYVWQVRVWDNTGKASVWSESASWRMGLLTPADWKAKWITPGFVEDSVNRPSPLFRKGFNLTKKVQSATAYITSHGLYEAQINGKRVGDAFLTPGWTTYNKRLQYQAYDVTNLLQPGANAVGATLGSGWYRGHIGFSHQQNYYGKDIALLFQLDVTYTDGTTATIVSDESWKSSTGPVRFAEIYNGATIDNRMQQKNWSTATFDDKSWSGVTVNDYTKNTLVATVNEPVRKHETFKPVKIFKTPKGEEVIDFGQNLVGWVQMKVRGNAGDTIRLSHAEILDKPGNFYTENLRAARAQNIYILKGGGEEVFEPQFTWQGFRYIKVEGYKKDLNAADFTAIALYSDMKPAGTFSCSNEMINKLQHNIQWGQKGNFLDVPTDCPQRDERLGWTGDAQVFSRTATYNMNVHNFFTKWLKDVAADQYPSGSVPFVIPDVLGNNKNEAGGSTGWSDVSTIIPWNMYLAYGDKQILENQYSSMKAWVKFMQDKSKNDLWNTGFHFGDWLFYSVNDDTDGSSAITSKYLIAQCFYAHSTQLMINTAKVLGKKDDEAYYTDLLAKIKKAFFNEYVTPNGLISSDTQTAYVLALEFDMLPENLRPQAAQRLANNIARYRNHLTTGFLGTPYLCHVLSRFGHADVAYGLLLQDTYPSWLYPVKMGATTIWERWDGIRPDGTLETPTMNSYNHYAYGAIGDWMYRVIAGIDTKEDAPGYKQIVIKPTLGGNLSNVEADYETNYGKVSSHWKIDGSNLLLDVEIPANTTATIYIPGNNSSTITESGKAIANSFGIKTGDAADGYVAVNIGSGVYHFSTVKP
ncbi:glycoside hydrolase family 78 protein [Mucilaginibacter sp. OK098]|uniref:glycoside hydrolase family 78 protein n=1 Tax=Mucilaginibacter sp. OK098 TaxID=1855297 RepID=UPI000923A8DF|nr:glycoside hydrolase family 78 protein [Mucilaginibacter sp. OK098]SHM71156.1 alpha-L-rhamnosidase [Mucilaginibacter sp. OK098]